MIELPEALARAEELDKTITGKTVEKVYPPSSPHKFCWFNGEPDSYDGRMRGKKVEGTSGFGIYVELQLSDGIRLCFNDGVNARLFAPPDSIPVKYQLRIDFTDGWVLLFTVAMYGGIICFEHTYDNEYYVISKEGLSPLADRFNEAHFHKLLDSVKPGISAKAFLATQQRIPGLGNGVLQDILFKARIHPKKKIGQLTEDEAMRLFGCIKEVLAEMSRLGGRDTEKDIWGNPGSYHTILSKNTYRQKCPVCGGDIVKMAYLGGSVYYCPACQPLE